MNLNWPKAMDAWKAAIDQQSAMADKMQKMGGVGLATPVLMKEPKTDDKKSLTENKCPICDSLEFKYYESEKDSSGIVFKYYPVLQCKKCHYVGKPKCPSCGYGNAKEKSSFSSFKFVCKNCGCSMQQ